MAKLPDHIIEQYGSTRKFKERKRQALQRLKSALNELRLGCAYFPDGGVNVNRIDYEVKILESELSIKNWGR